MDLERTARKLEPLRPKEVRRWRKLREQVDPEDRTLLDRQIVALADRVLGEFHNKILLSLPPRKLIRGTFNLGTVLYEQEKWPAGLDEGELLQNLAIFGRSGAGKTKIDAVVQTQRFSGSEPCG